jgi:hypothetical protein
MRSSLLAFRFFFRSNRFSLRVIGLETDVSVMLFRDGASIPGEVGICACMEALSAPSVAARIHLDLEVSWAKLSSTVAPFCCEFWMLLPRLTARREAPIHP